MKRNSILLCLLLCAALAAGLGGRAARAQPAPADLARVCAPSAVLTLLGMDTASGRTLFSLSGGEAGVGDWVVELVSGDDVARFYPEAPGGARFSGSVGPGPILAVHACGATCLAVERWSAGSWEPVGEPLAMPASATVYPTYDLSGSAWVLLYGRTPTAGEVDVRAFRLAGREWAPRGRLAVEAAAAPQPVPWADDAVVAGTALFSAAAEPKSWLSGLPGLPPEREGQVFPLGPESADYVDAGGAFFLSTDRGRTWRLSRWTPWGTHEIEIWRRGTDYDVDLPLGDRRSPLPFAWFDRRATRPADAGEEVLLTQIDQAGAWRVLASLPAEASTDTGDRLSVTHLLRTADRTWELVYGCAHTAHGSGLVIRRWSETAPSAPEYLPLVEAGWSKPPGRR